MAEWMNRADALAALGVRAQTLYAYVSRGRIAMMPDPVDPRRSLYLAEDVAALTTRRARGRNVARIAASTISWGEPSGGVLAPGWVVERAVWSERVSVKFPAYQRIYRGKIVVRSFESWQFQHSR